MTEPASRRTCSTALLYFVAVQPLLVVGCRLQDEDGAHSPAASAEIESTARTPPRRLLGDTVTIAEPEGLGVAGPWLVVADPSAAERVIVLDRRTGAITGTAGPRGSGPGEMRFPTSLVVESESPPRVLIFDTQNNRAVRFQVDASGRPHAIAHIPNYQGGVVENFVLTERGPVVGGAFRNGSLLLLDDSGRTVRASYGVPPLSREIYKGSMAYNGNRFDLAVDRGLSRFAVAFYYVSRIDLIDLRDGTVQEVQDVRPVPPPLREDPLREHYATHVGGVAVTERFVYVAYCDNCPEGSRQPRPGGKNWWERGEPHLVQAYTWDGRFVGEVNLDRRITAIAVAPSDSLLYASVEDPYPMIGEWVLPASFRAKR